MSHDAGAVFQKYIGHIASHTANPILEPVTTMTKVFHLNLLNLYFIFEMLGDMEDSADLPCRSVCHGVFQVKQEEKW